VRAAVINKRAGGLGPTSGRKAFQRPQRVGNRSFTVAGLQKVAIPVEAGAALSLC